MRAYRSGGRTRASLRGLCAEAEAECQSRTTTRTKEASDDVGGCRLYDLSMLYRESNIDAMSPVLGLPPATGDPTKVTVDGGSVSLEDEMGPLVVNENGTLSRIANWAEMTPQERERTVRILGKRNKLRLDKLKAEQGRCADAKPETPE